MKNTLGCKIWKLIHMSWKTKRLRNYYTTAMKIEILRNQLNRSCVGYMKIKKRTTIKPWERNQTLYERNMTSLNGTKQNSAWPSFFFLKLFNMINANTMKFVFFNVTDFCRKRKTKWIVQRQAKCIGEKFQSWFLSFFCFLWF